MGLEDLDLGGAMLWWQREVFQDQRSRWISWILGLTMRAAMRHRIPFLRHWFWAGSRQRRSIYRQLAAKLSAE